MSLNFLIELYKTNTIIRNLILFLFIITSTIENHSEDNLKCSLFQNEQIKHVKVSL